MASRSATRRAAEKGATVRPPREMVSAQAIVPEASAARLMFAGRFIPAELEEALYRVPKWGGRDFRVHARAAKMRNAFKERANADKIFEKAARQKALLKKKSEVKDPLSGSVSRMKRSQREGDDVLPCWSGW